MTKIGSIIVRVTLPAALALAVGATSARADMAVTGGKTSLFVSATDVAVPPAGGAFAIVASGQILRGKRKNVLDIEAMLTNITFPVGGTTAPAIYVTVNGFVAEPTLFPGGGWPSIINTCPQSRCVVSGSFFMDLDAMEVLSPGQFIGQPLTVELHAGDYAFAGFSESVVVLRANLQKK